MCDVVVSVARELRQGVLALLVGGEEAGVRRARAHHHRRHAADRPEGKTIVSTHSTYTYIYQTFGW